MKRTISIIIVATMLVATYILIFNFSSQTGAESLQLSRSISKTTVNQLVESETMTKNEKDELVRITNKLIRKLAHFSVYTLVGVLSLILLELIIKKESKWKLIIAISTGILYAISDEIHQIFTAGRSPLVIDIIIDSFGVIIGVLIVKLIIKLHRKRIEKNNKIHNEKM